MIQKLIFMGLLFVMLSACSQQSVKEEDLITLDEVITAVTDQEVMLGEADLPSISAFARELNNVLPESYFIDGHTFSIYEFPSTKAREKGMEDFEMKTASASVVEHERYTNKNILAFYEYGNVETHRNLESAINGLE